MGIIFSFVALLLLLFYIVLNARYSEKYKTVSGLKKKKHDGEKECCKFTWEKKSKNRTGRERSQPIFHLFCGETVLAEDPTVLSILFSWSFKKKKKKRPKN